MKVILISLFAIFYGCGLYITKPDVEIDNYPMQFHSNTLDLSGISVQSTKPSDFLVFNLNIRNKAPYPIMIDRSSIYLLNEYGIKFSSINFQDALEEKDALEASMKGWQNYLTIEPGKSHNTYVFFRIDRNKYTTDAKTELFVNIKKVQFLEDIQYVLKNTKNETKK